MSFQQAIEDYRYLKNQRYPDKAALKLVSDHHRLGTTLRNSLFRGVFADSDCRRRRSRITQDIEGRTLGVDWYNVLITVESYLKGYPIFVCDDGLLRDSSAVHGSYKRGKISERGITEILAAIASKNPRRIELYLDSPISRSGQMAEDLRSRLALRPALPFRVSLFPSADYPLKSFEGIVATADTSIIDSNPPRQIFDLARLVIEKRFHARIPTVEMLPDTISDR